MLDMFKVLTHVHALAKNKMRLISLPLAEHDTDRQKRDTPAPFFDDDDSLGDVVNENIIRRSRRHRRRAGKLTEPRLHKSREAPFLVSSGLSAPSDAHPRQTRRLHR